jgi:hypothetical protein
MSASRAESAITAGKAVDWSEFDAAVEAFKATTIGDYVASGDSNAPEAAA